MEQIEQKILKFREQFPILKKMTYLDSAALAQKPKIVINENNIFYENFAINSHSKDSDIGIFVNKTIQNTRKRVAKLVNSKTNEVIFTSGTTQSLNEIASMLSNIEIPKDKNEIILSNLNHISNLMPYLEFFKNKNMKFIFKDTEEEIINAINKKTFLISVPQINNSLPFRKNMNNIYKYAKQNNAFLINDAAQAIVHEKVDINDSDVIVFGSNKIYGPTGVGVLIIKEELIEKLSPVVFGGGAVESFINFEKNTYNYKNDIEKFEPGTPNIAGLFQFNKALEFFETQVDDDMKNHLESLSKYLYNELKQLPDVELFSKEKDTSAIFQIKNISAQDVVSYLGHNKVYARAGDFCQKHYLPYLKEDGYIRVSLLHYNIKEDIDKLINLLKEGKYFDFL